MDKRATVSLENAINNLNAARNDDISKIITLRHFPQIKETAKYVENMCERVEEMCNSFLDELGSALKEEEVNG